MVDSIGVRISSEDFYPIWKPTDQRTRCVVLSPSSSSQESTLDFYRSLNDDETELAQIASLSFDQSVKQWEIYISRDEAGRFYLYVKSDTGEERKMELDFSNLSVLSKWYRDPKGRVFVKEDDRDNYTISVNDGFSRSVSDSSLKENSKIIGLDFKNSPNTDGAKKEGKSFFLEEEIDGGSFSGEFFPVSSIEGRTLLEGFSDSHSRKDFNNPGRDILPGGKMLWDRSLEEKNLSLIEFDIQREEVNSKGLVFLDDDQKTGLERLEFNPPVEEIGVKGQDVQETYWEGSGEEGERERGVNLDSLNLPIKRKESEKPLSLPLDEDSFQKFLSRCKDKLPFSSEELKLEFVNKEDPKEIFPWEFRGEELSRCVGRGTDDGLSRLDLAIKNESEIDESVLEDEDSFEEEFLKTSSEDEEVIEKHEEGRESSKVDAHTVSSEEEMFSFSLVGTSQKVDLVGLKEEALDFLSHEKKQGVLEESSSDGFNLEFLLSKESISHKEEQNRFSLEEESKEEERGEFYFEKDWDDLEEGDQEFLETLSGRDIGGVLSNEHLGEEDLDQGIQTAVRETVKSFEEEKEEVPFCSYLFTGTLASVAVLIFIVGTLFFYQSMVGIGWPLLRNQNIDLRQNLIFYKTSEAWKNLGFEREIERFKGALSFFEKIFNP